MDKMRRFASYTGVLTWCMALLLSAFLAGCGGGGGGGDPVLGISGSGAAPAPVPGASSAKAITSYSLAGVGGFRIAGVIVEAAKTIVVTMPFGTPVTALVATFTHTGTGITAGTPPVAQVSGTTANNFTTNPVAYVVSAADGSTATYNVTVTVASISDKAITSYSLNGIAGVISEGTTPKTITVVMPAGTDLTTAKTAAFLTTGASVTVGAPAVTQVSGTTTNVFTQGTPKVYTVTAADNSTASYNVNVSVAPATAKAITSYSLDGIAGIISEGTTPKTITVVMPSGTDLTTAKTATFLTTGTSVKVGAAVQASGTTTNVFTQGTSTVYTVTAGDLTTASYNVNVSVALATDKAITSYSLDGVVGVISEATTPKTITVVMPSGTDLTTPKTATWVATGTSVKIGATQQFSGLVPTNVFTQGTPKVYTVTAGDLTTANYDVNVSVALATDKAITSYSLDGTAGVINEAAKTITVAMPSGTSLATAKTATWLTTGTSVRIGATQQFSALPPTNVFTQGTPKVYTVTAGDLTTQNYNVNVSVTPTNPGPAGAVDLLTVAPFGLIAWNAITNSAGPSHIFGDAALTQPGPGGTIASASGPGFNDVPGVPLTSTGVTNSTGVTPGVITAADNGTPAGIAALPQLLIDLRAVFDNLMLRAPGPTALTTPASAAAVGVNGGTFAAATDLSGYVLRPGVYATAASYGLSNTNGPLVLDAEGNADAVFVIRSTSAVTGITSTTGSVVLQGGAQSKNVFWVLEDATIGGGTFFQGTVVAGHTITLLGFANVEGRMLAGARGLASGAITLTSTNVITVPK